MLEDIDDVQISEDAFGRAVKFILVKLKEGQKSMMIFRASAAEFHNDIYMELLDGLDKGIEAEVTGGGWLHIVMEGKFIRIWGASTTFGPPDFETARQLLHERYPDFRIETG
ncbi:MAG: hypothetical protein KGI06_01970 [Candidatus Micrarchaeota archaeon]|nr:hypothetical protein [Candidatus Micrarchaeota archaeon]